MESRVRLASWALALMMFVACGSDDSSPPASTEQASDLPADMQAVLTARCWECHGATPRQGALTSLTTRQDLLTKPSSQGTSGKSAWPEAATRVQLAVQLMRFVDDPMPPGKRELATDAELAVFKAWIGAGCPATAGAAGAGGADAGCDPYDTPVVCTSAVEWKLGDPLQNMNPGRNCVGCHSVSGGPKLQLGGTVYPTAHEPDNCHGSDGVAAGATVEITDSLGATFALPVNAVGNFWLKAVDAPDWAPPFSARVKTATGVREMVAQQKDGDCNACHTKLGDTTDKTATKKAPGRIVLP